MFECMYISILTAKVSNFSNGMLPTVLVCVGCKKPNRVWKQTTIGIDEMVTALPFVSFGMGLAFLLVHSKTAFSDVTYLNAMCCCLRISAERMAGSYGRLLPRVL